MSGLFGSTVIKGNRLTEFSNTTATVGTVQPFGYGRYTSPGNVIWAPLPPKEHVTKKRQGKGGVKQETYTYTLCYAVRFGRKQIFGYWWVKRNGKIVYTQDPNAPAEDLAYAAKWLQKATFYYGTKDQLPDSTIESYEGTGQVSAFRDVFYIVVEDDDVTDGGGAVPNYEACIIASPPNVYLTSKLYPLEDIENVGPLPEFNKIKYDPDLIVDEAQGIPSFVGATLIPTVIYSTYNMPQEDNISCGQSFNTADLTVVAAYTTYNHPLEDLVSNQQSFIDATLVVTAGYQTYNMPQEDNVSCGQSFIGATLS